jgi:hypothetical protein
MWSNRTGGMRSSGLLGGVDHEGVISFHGQRTFPHHQTPGLSPDADRLEATRTSPSCKTPEC